jgi:hypothetical protein
MRPFLAFVGCVLLSCAALAQSDPAPQQIHRPFDQILDLQVRDGLVYYRALRSERGRLDRYIASLDVAASIYESWTREQKIALWINAYNAFVLQTVVDNYPIRGRAAAYPSSSIRQIPGAFEKKPHRAAGRTVTLDEIEKRILPPFNEPRAQLALGRGAVGSGRLRSEAFTAEQLAEQLNAVQAEFVTTRAMLTIDRTADQITVTPIMSWHEAEFVAAYDKGATGTFALRSPIERALVAFITPHLLPLEREFVQKNAFRVTYHAFDWRLNDLSGGRVN